MKENDRLIDYNKDPNSNTSKKIKLYQNCNVSMQLQIFWEYLVNLAAAAIVESSKDADLWKVVDTSLQTCTIVDLYQELIIWLEQTYLIRKVILFGDIRAIETKIFIRTLCPIRFNEHTFNHIYLELFLS